MTTRTTHPGIQETNDAFVAAVSSGDASAMAEVYTDDGAVLPPGGETVQGREALASFWRGALDGLGLQRVRLETVELEVLDDRAIEVGRGTLYGGGDAVLDEVKYLVIWRRTGDGWRWHRDIFNSSRGSRDA